MSILRSKHSGWTWEGRRTPFGGGSGGGSAPAPAPQTSTSYQTNLPEYARPYVETMLGAAQKQAYTYDDSGNITGFRPYIPYGATVSPTGQITNTAQEQAAAAVAPFSPMQEQAFGQVAQMRVPAQYGVGSQFAGAGGIGAANLAQQAAGVGQGYYGLATNPYAQAAFMSPYMQNAVDRQKFEAMRDYSIGLAKQRQQATGAGAFGGSRMAIAEAEANRNLQQQLQNIQAAGTQRAFEQAQQAQQFGANLGLQGLGTALQGTGQLTAAGRTLADIGGAQLQAQQGIIGLQSQAGAQQQALEQQRINQAMQNYALMQQYPQLQLSMMSSLLRGLPLQQATTQQYQAAPSAISQIGGLGAAGVGLYGMGRSAGIFGKEGGHVRKLAKGGITGLSKRVLMNPEDFSAQQIDSMTKKGMISQLVGLPVLDAKMKDEQRMKNMQAAQQPKPADTIAAEIMARAAAQGIDSAESNLPVMSAFDGGIVAMAEGGEVDDDGVVRYNEGGKSAFREDLEKFGKYALPDIDPITKKLREFGSYFTKPRQSTTSPGDVEVQPGYTPSSAPAPFPVEPAKPRILEDSKPSAAAAAVPAMPESTVDTSGKGITDILKRYEETLGKGEARDKEAKKEAFWSSLAEFGFGAMAGTSPFAATNIGLAGGPAVKSGVAALRDIRSREEKRQLARAQLGLEGEKLKAGYAKLGILEPFYRSGTVENLAKARAYATGQTGRGIPTGNIGFKDYMGLKREYEGYLTNKDTILASPIAKYLKPDEINALKAKPGTPSYERGMARATEIANQLRQQEMQEALQYQKVPRSN